MVDEQLHCLFDKKRRSFNFALKRLKNNFGSSGKMKAQKNHALVERHGLQGNGYLLQLIIIDTANPLVRARKFRTKISKQWYVFINLFI